MATIMSTTMPMITTTTTAMADRLPQTRQTPPPESGRACPRPDRGWEGVATTATARPDPAAQAIHSLPPASLLRLLAWLSPAFPVGGFSYSHSLEWAIEDGTVAGPADLEAWIGDVVRHGAARSDAILFAHAWRAAATVDTAALASLAELAAAFQPSRERHLETTAQGRAFLATVMAAWPDDRLVRLAAAFLPNGPVAYPIAVAAASAAAEIPLGAALAAWLGAFAANLVSAGVRAIPIGQTDGQTIVARLAPLIEEIAASASAASLDDLGGAALRADIASMRHETQYTRLFRS
jgi:urease accessory protein